MAQSKNRQDTSRKDAKGAKFGENIITSDFRRLGTAMCLGSGLSIDLLSAGQIKTGKNEPFLNHFFEFYLPAGIGSF
jgi:hypothetical protein